MYIYTTDISFLAVFAGENNLSFLGVREGAWEGGTNFTKYHSFNIKTCKITPIQVQYKHDI